MAAATTAEEAVPRSGVPGEAPRSGRRRRTILLLAAVTAVAAASTWLLYGSPWLRTTTVTVSGTRVLTPAEVRQAAAVPLGEPLASVDTGAVARRLDTRLHRIDSVDVSRSWPHTVSLNVTERTPSALIPLPGGGFTEVDDDGVRYATVATAPDGVPLLKLAPAPTATASTRYFGAKRLLRAGVEVAGNLPSAVRKDSRVITVTGYDSITVELTGGRTVVWGSPQDGGRKAVALSALMKAAKDAQNFDVSAPSAPAVSGG